MIAALATACGGGSESTETSTSAEAAGPDPATTKCSEFATMEEPAQLELVTAALDAKADKSQAPDTVLPMVVGLCDSVPDSTISEVLAGPDVVTTQPGPPPSETAPATPTP